MKLSFNKQVRVNASAEVVWGVLAREFNEIGAWSSVISHSLPLPEEDVAELGGRVCAIPGLGETHERLLYIDESAKRLSYSGTMPRAPYVKRAVNVWSVVPQGEHACIVHSRADAELPSFPWVLATPVIQLGMWWMWRRTAADLKHYVEHGVPHPRKSRQARPQRSTAP